jgi:plasmid maintenance system antidote protein VapI
MDLKDYFSTLDAKGRRDFAKKLGTSVAYLSQLANGHRKASPEMARRMVKKSDQVLTLSGIRPDIWDDSQAA